jgi:class 3 adenylate cyclase
MPGADLATLDTSYAPPDDARMREGDSRPGDSYAHQPSLVLYRRRDARPAVGSPRVTDLAPAMGTAADPGIRRTRRTDDVQRELRRLEASLVADHRQPAQVERMLATVLFTDIVDSTARAVALGDAAWRRLLDRHDRLSYGAVCECGGRVVKGTGDGLLATFDAPALALHCAKALRSVLSNVGIAIRAGVHTGEVELRGDDVAGIGVHIAARIAALASSGELLASRTVRDLVAGSPYTFTSCGLHDLRGMPDEWELLAVT